MELSCNKENRIHITEGARTKPNYMHTLPTAPRTTVVSEHPYTVAYFTGANM
jgi:hypothetical protein